MPRGTKSINVEVGTRIKQRRTSLRLTRERLAELSGYSANFVAEVERGRSGLSSESIRAFSSALQISADSLLFGTQSDGFEYVAEKLKSVPVEKREHIFRIIEEAIQCAQ